LLNAPPQKACPVIIRKTDRGVEILAFRHPAAGCQLVKGTIEDAELVLHAAERELLEESGVAGRAIAYLGAVHMTATEQEWHFVLCQVPRQAGPLPETRTHWTSDGGGLEFEFFWHPLGQETDESWHPIFRDALAFIAGRINNPEFISHNLLRSQPAV
jgi:ADP-ribose pyrophosphatase YjhB (NUDIX family)